jgi:type IV fimbrial biogenesis protein FimT
MNDLPRTLQFKTVRAPLPSRRNGFSVIELMVTVTIAAVVLGMAVPAFQETIRNNRTAAATNQLVAALTLARSEAVNRNVQVTLARRGPTNQVWEAGWDVFVDIDADGVFNGTDVLLKRYDPLPTGYTLRTTTNNDWIAYLGSGAGVGSDATSNAETFSLCDGSADTIKSRSIVISATGRPVSQEGTTQCP